MLGNCTCRQRAACLHLRQCNLSYVKDRACGKKQCSLEQSDEFFSCSTAAAVPPCGGSCSVVFSSSLMSLISYGIFLSWSCFGVLPQVSVPGSIFLLHLGPGYFLWNDICTVLFCQTRKTSFPIEVWRCTIFFFAAMTLNQLIGWFIYLFILKKDVDCISMI